MKAASKEIEYLAIPPYTASKIQTLVKTDYTKWFEADKRYSKAIIGTTNLFDETLLKSYTM